MRVVLAISALLLNAAAVTPPTAVVPHGTPPPVSPHQGDQAADASNNRACRDRIERVRHERRLPKLDREKASDVPLLIAAVDERIDGCSVLVMRDNINDIRPLPQSDDAPAFRPLK
jgi:hypothetical protein